MFRLSHYVKNLIEPKPFRTSNPQGPVVIWNLLRKCNLACKHCYANSYFKDFDGELSCDQCLENVNNLKQAGVNAIILSGGEPLLHPYLFDIAKAAKNQKMFVALSSNGVLLDQEMAHKLKQVPFDYVGISLDGIGETHDLIRGQNGAFIQSLEGIKNGVSAGLKVGVRTTLTHYNDQQVEQILNLCIDKGVEKFYLSHLNYGGRGNKREDAHFSMTRKVMFLLFDKALEYAKNGIPLEIVTGNNDADAALMLMWAKEHFSEKNIRHVENMLIHWGGNSSGIGVANIDSQGEVHPDSFWSDIKLGNIKDKTFGEIWSQPNNVFLNALRSDRSQIHGRCQSCQFFKFCNGNTRTRAHQLLKDLWASDPGCYLSDAEIKNDSNICFNNVDLTESNFVKS